MAARSVDDEAAVVAEQRHLAEEQLLLFDVDDDVVAVDVHALGGLELAELQVAEHVAAGELTRGVEFRREDDPAGVPRIDVEAGSAR